MTSSSTTSQLEQAEPADLVPMTHRQVMEAMTGLMLGMFVAILASTVVSNALPTIISDLHAGELTYTWVVISALLATTVSTPIWGKLADLTNKKNLVQISLVIYMVASVAAGLSQNSGTLIAARVFQGIGAGGLTALVQTIMAAMISPRDRGRYSGYLGAVLAIGTVSGPLVGGTIVDTPGLGWRWCFFLGIPVALVAFVVLQRTLKLPVTRRKVKVDWAGTTLITGAVSLLLIWVSFAGDKYDWISWQTGTMLGGAVALAAVFGYVETRASEPIIPLHLFRNRTMRLSVLSSLLVGIVMFASTTFLGQYFQVARGDSPTKAGLLTLPMILGLALTSTVAGQIITRTGRWKAILVLGGILIVCGVTLVGTLRYDTDYWVIALAMFPIGAGLGMTMQNLVLIVQNQVAMDEIGAASAVVSFARSLGGVVGVSALGAFLSQRVDGYVRDGLAKHGLPAAGGGDGVLPKVSTLPPPVRTVVESSFGHAIADIFLYTAPAAVIALVAILFIKEVPLRTKNIESAKQN
jgi:EmrB/QacA subfamily drug resistance transporter